MLRSRSECLHLFFNLIPGRCRVIFKLSSTWVERVHHYLLICICVCTQNGRGLNWIWVGPTWSWRSDVQTLWLWKPILSVKRKRFVLTGNITACCPAALTSLCKHTKQKETVASVIHKLTHSVLGGSSVRVHQAATQWHESWGTICFIRQALCTLNIKDRDHRRDQNLQLKEQKKRITRIFDEVRAAGNRVNSYTKEKVVSEVSVFTCDNGRACLLHLLQHQHMKKEGKLTFHVICA